MKKLHKHNLSYCISGILSFIMMLSMLLSSTRSNAQVNINVNTSTVLANDVRHKYGINVNAGIDNDVNRPNGARPLHEAIAETGAKHIRFPGGKKTMFYAWASHPYDDPSTHYWSTAGNPWYANAALNTLNFDEFMTICSQTGAEAHINVAWNPEGGLTEELAAAWVEYANVTNNYNVKYWEIGNEMWQKEYGFSVSGLAAVVSAYSQAMKAVDPTIKIGVSWDKAQDIINACGDALDFVTISDYTTYQGSYDAYARKDKVKLIRVDENVSKKIVVSEFAQTTWQRDSADFINSTGKGIINFDQVGQYLLSPNTEYACFWNTRWYSCEGNMFDAFDNDNNLLPVSKSLSLWEKFLMTDLVSATSSNRDVVTYASYDNVSGDLNVFLINKRNYSKTAVLNISSETTYSPIADVWQYKGEHDEDKHPTLGNIGTLDVSDNSINSISLPSTSITVIVLSKNYINVEGISLSFSSLNLTPQETFNLTANVNPLDATNSSITWSTSNSDIANVNSNGEVTGISEGSVEITATTNDGNYAASCIVNISPIVNLVSNPGFETGALDPWICSEGSGWGGITAAGSNSGSYSGWCGGGSASISQTIHGLSPNTNYKFTCFVYNWSGDGNDVTVGVTNTGASVVSKEIAYSHPNWTKVCLEFITGNNSTSADIYLSSDSAGLDTWGRIDDVIISEINANRISNPGFETGTLEPWTCWEGTGWGGVTTKSSNSGTYAGWCGGGSASITQTITSLCPSTTYTLSCHAYNWSGDYRNITVGVTSTGGTDASEEVCETAPDWIPVSFDFTTGITNTSVDVYLSTDSLDLDTWGRIDDVNVSFKSGANPTSYSLSTVSNNQESNSSDQYHEDPKVFDVYPNPVNSVLNIKGKENFSCELYNMKGILVASEATLFGEIQLNIEELKQGLYILKISDEKHIRIERIIIN